MSCLYWKREVFTGSICWDLSNFSESLFALASVSYQRKPGQCLRGDICSPQTRFLSRKQNQNDLDGHRWTPERKRVIIWFNFLFSRMFLDPSRLNPNLPPLGFPICPCRPGQTRQTNPACFTDTSEDAPLSSINKTNPIRISGVRNWKASEQISVVSTVILSSLTDEL